MTVETSLACASDYRSGFKVSNSEQQVVGQLHYLTTWATPFVQHGRWEQASGLVGEVYAGFEDQARGMSPIDLLLDLLRMAAVDKEALRKDE